MKKIGFLKALCLLVFAGIALHISAESANEVTVTGTVEKIAEDGSSIQVDGQIILVSTEILDEAMIEVGDKLQVSGIRGEQGIRLIDFRFLTDDTEMVPYQGSDDGEEYPEEEPGDENEEDIGEGEDTWDWGEVNSSQN